MGDIQIRTALFSGANDKGEYLDHRPVGFSGALIDLKSDDKSWNSYQLWDNKNFKKDDSRVVGDSNKQYIAMMTDIGKYHKTLDAEKNIKGKIQSNLDGLLRKNWSKISQPVKDLIDELFKVVDDEELKDGNKFQQIYELNQFYETNPEPVMNGQFNRRRFNINIIKDAGDRKNPVWLKKYVVNKGNFPHDLLSAYLIGWGTGNYEAKTEETDFAYDFNKIYQEMFDNNKVEKVADIRDECLTTKVNQKDTLTCNQYLDKCLRGDQVGIEECKEYLKNPNFFDIAIEEVKSMHPEIALQTLKSFGFQFITDYDEEHEMEIKRVEEFNEWLDRMRTERVAERETIEEINANRQLRQYLIWVTQLVNYSPELLNKGIHKKNEPYFPDPNRFKHTSFGRMGLKARVPVRNSCYKDIYGIEQLIKNNNISLGIRLNAPIVNGIVPVMIGGGSMVTIDQAELSVNQLKESRKPTADLLNNLFQYLIGKLNAYNKSISENDLNKIIKLIDNLRKQEKNLYDTMIMIEQYSKLIEIFGQDRVREELNVTDIRKAVEARSKLFGKKVKRENELISVLKALTEAV